MRTERDDLLCNGGLINSSQPEDGHGQLISPNNSEKIGEGGSLALERDALLMQNQDLLYRLENMVAGYQELEKGKDDIEKDYNAAVQRYEALVKDKVADYSWHKQEKNCIWALKSEDPVQAEASATIMAQGLYSGEIK